MEYHASLNGRTVLIVLLVIFLKRESGSFLFSLEE